MQLFPEIQPKEVIRTLGFYQPFGSLMLHGKIETRWVRDGKKPPFPLGKYLFYTTQKPCEQHTLFNWCGINIMHVISGTLSGEDTADMCGMAIGIGTLKEVRRLTKDDEYKAFVQYVGAKTERNYAVEDSPTVTKVQWALVFDNVQRIEPFKWLHGKQGVGFAPDEVLPLIKIQQPQ